MKMVFAIISKSDEDITVTALNEAGFFATKLSSTGGFLKKTNTSIIVGTDDDKVPQVLDILRRYAGKRIDEMPYVAPSMSRPSAGRVGRLGVREVLIQTVCMHKSPGDRSMGDLCLHRYRS